MCNQEVICSLKEKVHGSQGTAQFLQIIRDVVDSFLDKQLLAQQRVRKMWYALFLIRIWYRFIEKRKDCTLKNNFISTYCYSCIGMNAHSLIMIILYLEKTNQPELFLPYFYDSQPCEKTFRAFRSLTTAYSTITNCTVMEALSRLRKIDFQDEITHATSPAFVYPRIDKKIELKSIEPLPTPYEIYNEIIFAKKCATATAIKLGLISKNADDSYFKCHLKPHSLNIQKKLNKLVNRKRSQNTKHNQRKQVQCARFKKYQIKRIKHLC